MGLRSQVMQTIEKYGMISPGDLVLVGVSGGPDSVALLHVLQSLRQALCFGLHVAHLNHMFRGEESEEEYAFVEKLCQNWQIPCLCKQVNVPQYLKDYKGSTQQGAREVRYRFYQETADGLGATRIALGHHAGDQAETVLLNLIRGTGLKGLRGIPPVREERFIRPLLETGKMDILEYCKAFDLPYRMDSSNLKTVYLRNKVRLELIPLLEQQYNPKMADSLLRLSEIVRDEDDFLDSTAGKVLEDVLHSRKEEKITLHLERMLRQPVAIQRRVLLLTYCYLTEHKHTLSYEHIHQVLKVLSNKDFQGKVSLPGGIFLIKRYGFLEMTIGTAFLPLPFYRHDLKVPGITHIPEINKNIVTEVLDFERAGDPRNFSSDQTLLDLEKLKGSLIVRRRQEGDVFSPLGVGGKVKLKKLLIDWKLPQEERDYVPLIVCGKDIVWVAGYRPGEPWKVSEKTKKCLLLRLVNNSEYLLKD